MKPNELDDIFGMGNTGGDRGSTDEEADFSEEDEFGDSEPTNQIRVEKLASKAADELADVKPNKLRNNSYKQSRNSFVSSKFATIINEDAGSQVSETHWFSDSNYDHVKNGVSVATETYTSEFALFDDEDQRISTLKHKDEYIFKKINTEVSEVEIEQMMK
jgi:hypothetical protein